MITDIVVFPNDSEIVVFPNDSVPLREVISPWGSDEAL